MLLISVQPGEELIEVITRQLQAEGVRHGAIVSLIGAVDSACISNMPKGDARSDILNEYEQPMEMSAKRWSLTSMMKSGPSDNWWRTPAAGLPDERFSFHRLLSAR